MRRRGTSGGRGGGASTPTKDGASNAGDHVTRGPSDGARPWSTLALVLVAVVFAVLGRLGRHAAGALAALGQSDGPPDASSYRSDGGRLVTPEELRRHDGIQEPTLWLAILGEVFDVTKGERHYGAGGGYAGFVGVDGTRAFHTGHFNTAEGLTPDVSGLPDGALLALREWADFYAREYARVGRLAPGHYHDERGEPTPARLDFDAAVERARLEKASAAANDERFPACRARWSQDTGGEVWCERDAGYPRKELTHGSNGKPRVRCACFPDEGFSDNRQLYPGCASNARRCAT